MAYDQAASDWQAEADRYRAERDEARMELRRLRASIASLRAAGVPTTPEHEDQHRRMEDQIRDALAAGSITLNSSPTGRLRRGSQVGRTLYDGATDANPKGRFVGCVDTPELAAEIVEAVNQRRAGEEEVPDDDQ